MTKRVLKTLTIGWLLAGLIAAFGQQTFAEAILAPTDLRCENLANPRGIDTLHPRLSWILKASGRGQSQTAYQVIVASSRKNLAAGKGGLWDSGKVASSQSIQVPYAGKRLASGAYCYWKVRVWGARGTVSKWSKPAFWTMGLLQPQDWHAKWIGLHENVAPHYLHDTSWIWYPVGEPQKAAPPGRCYFRRVFVLPADREIVRARLFYTGGSRCQAWVNGHNMGAWNNPHAVKSSYPTYHLRPGTNVLTILGDNLGAHARPAGVVAWLKVNFDQGPPLIIRTDDRWKTSLKAPSDWKEATFDDSPWMSAKVLGPAGMAPWGPVTAPASRRLPARWLRKEFTAPKRIKRATVYFSGLGWSELYINGRKVGDNVLSPPLSQYPKRVYYETYDVTKSLRRGDNALGVVLGNGRFYAPRLTYPTKTLTFGFPKLLLQLHIQYADGTSTDIVSDASWKITTNGPIVANNVYDGEIYDARKAFPGWDKCGFDDSQWQPAQVVSAPGGVLSGMRQEPIRVTQRLKPVSVKELRPGAYIFDMGQNMAGWCRLKVHGPAGTRVCLLFAETLKPDGALSRANLRSAEAMDVYILNGHGTETWEPRFTYHGFRYVEVTGYPGKPTLNSLTACVVNDDLPSAGSFKCSNPLLNRIYHNVVWGVRSNYHSIPTDCPQRDERQGWLGDRAEESRGETYIFDNEALYAKWLQDMADAQKSNGSVPDVCPSYWPVYNDDVSWPSTSIIIPEMLRDQFGDEQVIAQHYDCMRNWIKHMDSFVTNGIISRDNYGDWCVPPRGRKKIHTTDPNRITSGVLIATACFYHDLCLMDRYATLLGKATDARQFHRQAETLKTAFNKKFLNHKLGQYGNGTQTSCVLPLAFGMVPDGMHHRIFEHLVHKITVTSHDHIGTGLVGGHYLMQVLTDNGRPDLAWTIATQKTYPSWGYMVEHGATTIWELWNANTAPPGMNSRNHVMLVGDLATWLYQDLAGIKPDPEHPGFKHIIMRPIPVAGLQFVKATHRSPYGWIVSDWKKNRRAFDWQIKIPPNTTATVYLPARSAETVTESGHPLAEANGVRILRAGEGRVVVNIESGAYHFVCKETN